MKTVIEQHRVPGKNVYSTADGGKKGQPIGQEKLKTGCTEVILITVIHTNCLAFMPYYNVAR